MSKTNKEFNLFSCRHAELSAQDSQGRKLSRYMIFYFDSPFCPLLEVIPNGQTTEKQKGL